MRGIAETAAVSRSAAVAQVAALAWLLSAGIALAQPAGGGYPGTGAGELGSEPPADVRSQRFQAGEIVARVGNEPILAGDLFGPINQLLEPYRGKAPEEVLEEQRRQLMKQLLPSVIDTKLMYLDFLREVPDDRLGDLNRAMAQQFEQRRLPQLIKEAQVSGADELDAKLRSYGSSLQKARQSFAETVLARQQLRKVIDLKPEITHDEMRRHYEAHLEKYEISGKARWEHLMVRFDRFASRQEAESELARMGNEVLGGAPLPAVARRRSHGFAADRGGYHDWTTQGSLRSKELDRQIFSLPTGRLSQIFADDDGYHIVRVIERMPAMRVPFKAPEGTSIAEVRIEENPRSPTDSRVVVRLENKGPYDAPVEVTVFLADAFSSQFRPFEAKTFGVPRLGSDEVVFEIEKVQPDQLTADTFRVDIEPQARIEAELRQERIDAEQSAYLARLRSSIDVWTVYGDFQELLAEMEKVRR